MMLFNKLAEALINEGEKDKALNVLDKCMQVLPPENIPLDYTALSTGELYYALGQKEKAEEVFTGIADDAIRTINWIFRLNPVQLASVEAELQHNLAVLNQVLLVSKHYNPEFGKKYQEEFDNFRMAYSSVNR
jgi:tetratricopeptide (TPR) repeat protein